MLLLSATPYKMYTLHHEKDDDHYRDFIQTVRFLYDDHEEARRLEGALDRYKRAMYRLAVDSDEALRDQKGLRDDIRRRLARVMTRTERLMASETGDDMLREVAMGDLQLTAEDVRSYLALQRVARALDQGDMLAYWKSAPYMLSFMETYQIK